MMQNHMVVMENKANPAESDSGIEVSIGRKEASAASGESLLKRKSSRNGVA
jgi:hypothetical protein